MGRCPALKSIVREKKRVCNFKKGNGLRKNIPASYEGMSLVVICIG